MLKRLTRKEIEEIFLSDSFTEEEIIETVEKELGLTLEKGLPKKEIIDKIFDIYNKALDDMDQKTKTIAKKSKKSRKSTGSKSGGISRKDFIVNLVKEGKYTKPQILEKVSEEFNYKVTGKSPNTRVSRVLRELDSKGQLKQAPDGILSFS